MERGLGLAAVDEGRSGVTAALRGRVGSNNSFFARTLGGPKGVIETPGSASPFALSPSPNKARLLGLRPILVPRPGQALALAGEPAADAEYKLFGYLLTQTERETEGALAVASGQMMCPSCYANLLRLRALRPGINIFSSATTSPWFPGAGAGAAGAIAAQGSQ